MKQVRRPNSGSKRHGCVDGVRTRRRLFGGAFVILVLAALLRPEITVFANGDTIPDRDMLFLPLVQAPPVEPEPTPEPTPEPSPEPTPEPTPAPVYDALTVVGDPVDRPPAVNADLNLALRGYVDTDEPLLLVDLNGPTDNDAPQLAGLFNHQRGPDIVSVHQVRDWDWDCGEHGCAADPISSPPVTLIGLRATPGEAIFIPTRNQEIHGGDYKVLVLYATPERITLTYTREDTPAIGYVVHIEEIAVEPALVTFYEELDAEGRSRLPALRNGEQLGSAANDVVKVVIRDTGSFMEPRSRKDWWVGW